MARIDALSIELQSQVGKDKLAEEYGEYVFNVFDGYKPEYKDVLAYIHSVGCDYYFNYIPLQRLGLPVEE